MKKINPQGRSQKIEVFLSGLGAAGCLLITYFIWSSLSPSQDMWLLPGGYFVELAAGAVICFWAYSRQYSRASTLSWIYCGVLVTFIVLAGFTVGFLYIPVFLIFGGLSIYSVIKHRQKLLIKLGIFALFVLVQLALMLSLIRFFR